MAAVPIPQTYDRDGLADDDSLGEASEILARGEESYIPWPFAALNGLAGALAPATLTYLVGFSGRGKSSLITSTILRWAEQGVKVDLLPTEIPPAQWALNVAAMEAGYDPGLIASGDYLRQPDAEEVRATVKRSLLHVKQGLIWSESFDRWQNPIRVNGAPGLDVPRLEAACYHAARRNARVLVLDHIDMLTEGKDDVAGAYAVNNMALKFAHTYNLAIVALSQANLQALQGTRDKLASYLPLPENAVMWGGKKRQLGTTVLTIYRPLRERGRDETDEAYADALKQARAGTRDPGEVLMPHAMGICLAKSRNWGAREGKKILLGIKHGRVGPYEALPYSLR